MKKKSATNIGLHVFVHSDTVTCTLALFRGDQQSIKELCMFDLIKSDPDAPQVQYIRDGYYFIGSHYGSFLHELCEGKQPNKINSCNLCLIKPRCGRSIESDEWFIPANINSCTDFKDTEISHPVNLMIPAEMNELALHVHTLPINVSYSRPLDIHMPNTEVYTAHMDEVVSNDKKLSYDLKQIAKLFQKNKSLFGSVSDKLFHDIRWVQTDYGSAFIMGTPSIAVILSITSTILSTVCLYKLHKIQSLVAYTAVQQIASTDSLEYSGLTPPAWLLNKVFPTPPAGDQLTTSPCDTQFIQNLVLLSIPLGILVIFLFTWTIKIWFKVHLQYDSHIFLVIYNDNNCIHLPLRKLQKCPLSYVLHLDQPETSGCNGLFKPMVRMIWKNTHLHDKFSQETLVFPQYIRVPLAQRLTVASVLRSPHKIEVVFQHKRYNYYPIPETARCDFTNEIESEAWTSFCICVLSHRLYGVVYSYFA